MAAVCAKQGMKMEGGMEMDRLIVQVTMSMKGKG